MRKFVSCTYETEDVPKYLGGGKQVLSQEAEVHSKYCEQRNTSCRLRGMAVSAWRDTGAVQRTPQPALPRQQRKPNIKQAQVAAKHAAPEGLR